MVCRNMKKLLILEVVLLLCTAQFFTEGYPHKNSFRKHARTEKEQSHENEIKSNSYKPRKERIKNSRGKAKDFLDYELDHILSDHPMSEGDGGEPSSNRFVNYYQPNTGLDHMHSRPVYHDHATQFSEPHLRYDYTYDNDVSSKRHGTNRRVDSYAGEMIDDENTLSHYIAPPVYENNQNRHKTHPSQDEKMPFGNSDTENANTKSFMNSLSSLLSPLSLSDSQRKSLQSPSNSEIDNFQSDVEYHGNYNVQNKHMDSDDNSWDSHQGASKHNPNVQNKNMDSDDNGWDSHKDASKHNPDSDADERDSKYSDQHETSHFSNRDDDRDSENSHEDRDSSQHDDDYSRRHQPEESKDFENYDNNKDESDDDYSRYDRSNDNELGQARSSEYHEQGDRFSSNEDRQRYEDDKYSSNDYDGSQREDNGKEHFEKHEDDHEPDRSKDRAPADSEQKPIEMMQDLSGKLHSLTKGVQSNDVASDVQKYLPHDQEQKDP